MRHSLFFQKKIITILFLILINFKTQALETYNLYLDADFSGAKASSISIQQGIETALFEVNHKLFKYQLNLVIKNHRGNSLRSKRNLEAFLQDPNALLVFSGLHSPPILANKKFINQNEILLLDPWAAAGPITRTTHKKNWIFRLSIDDQKAGFIISDNAIKEGFTKPFLLLEDTGWGRSNEKTITKALKQKNLKPMGVKWFNWGIGKNHARLTLREIKPLADVIFFVGNATEGKTFAKAMSELSSDERLPIRSHWGITGGDFADIINKDIRQSLDLQFIQTSFSFNSDKLTALPTSVFNTAKKNFKQLLTPQDIKAQTGFIHGYDLTKILISAINQSGLTGDKKQDQHNIHKALESLQKPVEGLIKTYIKPFSPYMINQPDAHEALSFNDYVMAYYGDDNEIILIKNNEKIGL